MRDTVGTIDGVVDGATDAVNGLMDGATDVLDDPLGGPTDRASWTSRSET